MIKNKSGDSAMKQISISGVEYFANSILVLLEIKKSISWSRWPFVYIRKRDFKKEFVSFKKNNNRDYLLMPPFTSSVEKNTCINME